MTSFGRLRLIHHHRHLVATRLILWLLCAALINLLCLNVMMIALMRYCAHFPVALIIAIMYLLPSSKTRFYYVFTLRLHWLIAISHHLWCRV